MSTQVSQSLPLIYERMALVNQAVTAISKGRTNEQQRFKFRGIDDVYNELHPLLAEHKIFIIPEVVHTEFVPQAKGYFARAKMAYHFTTTDGSQVTAQVIGEAVDYGDKAMNKAMSIALKYALFQVFTIPTEDAKDPDATSPEVIPPEYQPATETQISDAIFLLQTATDFEGLTKIYRSLPKNLQGDRNIIHECSQIKARFNQVQR